MHADVNMARHNAGSSDKVIDMYKSTRDELCVLTERFLSDAEHSIRDLRMAPGLLSSNPYFFGAGGTAKVFSGNIFP
jgi:hypothetical protein